MTFDEMELHEQIRHNIRAIGFETPTPIQSQAIAPILAGRDVVGLAQTGTGKTAAFAIPMLHRLMNGPRRRLRALVVGPTRELAEQTCEAFAKLGRRTGLAGATIYGGVSMRPQVTNVRRGAELVVACPGRLLDHLRQGTIRLDHVECLVLDEADRMLDMGFLPDIRRILDALPATCQKLLFSATMPADIRTLAHEVLRNPVTLQIAPSRPAESVAHAVYPVTHDRKPQLLMAILERTDRESVLVFARTRHRAQKLARQLAEAGHATTCLQGDLSQRQRQQAMDGFRNGRFRVMVATDIAARGMDVASVSHVINFDMPGTVDDYTHRIGRTGRAARSGDAFTLVTREDEPLIHAIGRVLGAPIERRRMDAFDYGPERSAPVERRAARPQAGGRGAPAGAHTRRAAPRHFSRSRPGSHAGRRAHAERTVSP